MVSTLKSRQYTPVAIDSFFQHTKLQSSDRFILIDNDQSLDASLAEKYPISIQSNKTPLGFAENVNFALQLALDSSADLIFLNNDLVFSNNWFAPLEQSDDAIYSPLCNRDVQYANSTVVMKTSHVAHTFVTAIAMELEEYLGNEAAFAALVEAHQRQLTGAYSTLTVPFFCIRIPYQVSKTVGLFDQDFGTGGGEDYDYALRCFLAGFDVRLALNSYILHFYGKSTWYSETDEERNIREQKMFGHFINKWGNDLFELVFRENMQILKKAPAIDEKNRSVSLRKVVEALKK